jgi:cellulose synthase/poly-beta-1,6-N-acetylglucosamine synthase-like glycosyltransferase
MANSISILIPTKGRQEELTQLCESLARLDDRDLISHEIIIINNAPEGKIAQSVEELVRGYIQQHGARWRYVREAVAGKSRALNTGIRHGRGNILAFLDDDVVVSPSWLKATAEFFATSSYDVKQGAIHIPPAFAENQEFLTLLKRYRTIYYLTQPWPRDYQPKSLNAANLALRRELLDKSGLFDERLGPGASGTSMDSEFGDRLKRLGVPIGYEAGSVVFHQVDWGRLTDSYFRWRNEAEGRSNLIYKKISLPNILYQGGRSLLAFGWYWLFGSKRKKYRMKGRCFRYAAMLKVKFVGTPTDGGAEAGRPKYHPTHDSI